MPLWIFPAIYAVVIVATMIAGIWLLLHLTALAHRFAGRFDIVPSPKRPQASRRAVHIALATFAGGLLLTLTMQVLAMTGVANAWLH